MVASVGRIEQMQSWYLNVTKSIMFNSLKIEQQLKSALTTWTDTTIKTVVNHFDPVVNSI